MAGPHSFEHGPVDYSMTPGRLSRPLARMIISIAPPVEHFDAQYYERVCEDPDDYKLRRQMLSHEVRETKIRLLPELSGNTETVIEVESTEKDLGSHAQLDQATEVIEWVVNALAQGEDREVVSLQARAQLFNRE